MLLREPRPHSLSPHALAIAGWIAFGVAGVTFITLAWNVAAHAPLVQLDFRVTDWLQEHRSEPLTALMLGVTHGNSLAAIAGWSVLFAAVLWRLGERYWILTLAAAVGGGMLLNWILKLSYQRARPASEEALVTLSTFSFPSGHTSASVTFYGVLAAFIVSRFHDLRVRAACVVAALAMVGTVAFSRVYLGAHHLSDVVAAACSATAWLVLCLLAGRELVHMRGAAR